MAKRTLSTLEELNKRVDFQDAAIEALEERLDHVVVITNGLLNQLGKLQDKEREVDKVTTPVPLKW